VQELTPLQFAVIERLVGRGFQLVAFPLYANAIGVRRESWAALVVPEEGAGLCLLGRPGYLIEGNLSVRVQREGRTHFVWKKKSVHATPDLLQQLNQFAEDLQNALLPES
jgi:hypothetical protein